MKMTLKLFAVLALAGLLITGCRKNSVQTTEVYDPGVDGIAVRPLNIPDDQLAKRVVTQGRAIAVNDDRITEDMSVPAADLNQPDGLTPEMPGGTADPNGV